MQDETAGALKALNDIEEIREVMLYSTCNRVEVVLVTTDREQAIEKTKAFISEHNKIPLDQFEDTLYVHRKRAKRCAMFSELPPVWIPWWSANLRSWDN